MNDKQKKFKELIEFAYNFDKHTLSTQWDEWKDAFTAELDDAVKTEEELNELIECINDENLGEITKNIIDSAATNLVAQKNDEGEWET